LLFYFTGRLLVLLHAWYAAMHVVEAGADA
jgi:hypothetical protein